MKSETRLCPGLIIQVADRKRGRRTVLEILRRLGLSPRERGSLTNGTCPDIFELEDGRFAVIGTDLTHELEKFLPPDAGRADYERIVVVSRETLVAARKDIPSS